MMRWSNRVRLDQAATARRFGYAYGMNQLLIRSLVAIALLIGLSCVSDLSGQIVPGSAVFAQTSGDTAPIADPATVGLSTQRLDRLSKYLQAEVLAGTVPGAVVAIARRDQLVYLQAFGHRDDESRDPMPVNALFDLSSLTEAVTAVGALALEEQGAWLLSDSVGSYLDPFKRRPLRIFDLLRHTDGLPLSVSAPNAATGRIRYSLQAALGFTGSGFIRTLADSRDWRSANQVATDGFSFDLLGLAIEAAAGQTLGAYLLQTVFVPLDMWDTGFNPGTDHAARIVRPAPNATIDAQLVTGWAPVRDLSTPVSFDCGGSCLYSSAADYLRFARFLLNQGVLDGRRVLSRTSVAFMTSNRLGTLESRMPAVDEIYNVGPARSGLGYGVSVRPGNSGTAAAVMLDGSTGEFSRAAPTGPYFWADPQEQLAVVVLAVLPDPVRRLRLHRVIRALVRQAISD